MSASEGEGIKPLISALVDDTTVYGPDGRKLGSLYSFHIERQRGQVEYAVISTGGLLGLGQAYHPIPFALLQARPPHAPARAAARAARRTADRRPD